MDAKSCLGKGMKSFEEDKYKEAITFFTEAINLNSDNLGYCYFYRGSSYVLLEKYDKAIVDYDKAIDLDQNDSTAYFLRGYAYNKQGRYKKAIEDYTKAIDLDPENSDAFCNRGDAYVKQGEYEKAVEDYTEAIKLKPDHSAVYFLRGCAYGKQGKNMKAIVDYDKAIDLDPENSDAFYNRGCTYAEQGKYKNVVEDCTKAIKLKPDNSSDYFMRGYAYANQGKYEKALEDFTRVVKLEPNFSAFFNRGTVYARKGEHKKAIVDYTKAIELNPKIIWGFFHRGNSYAEQGNQKKAVEDFTQAIKLTPNDGDSYFNRGLAYFNQEKYAKAIADYTKAIKLTPNDGDNYFNRGFAYSKQEKYAKAIADYTKAIELSFKDPVVYCERGIAYFLRHEYDSAHNDFKKLLRIFENRSVDSDIKIIDVLSVVNGFDNWALGMMMLSENLIEKAQGYFITGANHFDKLKKSVGGSLVKNSRILAKIADDESRIRTSMQSRDLKKFKSNIREMLNNLENHIDSKAVLNSITTNVIIAKYKYFSILFDALNFEKIPKNDLDDLGRTLKSIKFRSWEQTIYACGHFVFLLNDYKRKESWRCLDDIPPDIQGRLFSIIDQSALEMNGQLTIKEIAREVKEIGLKVSALVERDKLIKSNLFYKVYTNGGLYAFTKKKILQEQIYKYGIWFDSTTGQVYMYGKPLFAHAKPLNINGKVVEALTGDEYKLLKCLLKYDGQICTYEKIFEEVWCNKLELQRIYTLLNSKLAKKVPVLKTEANIEPTFRSQGIKGYYVKLKFKYFLIDAELSEDELKKFSPID